jgi:hypothetical protein
MHDTQTAPHDPFRKLATAIIAQAVRDYTAPYPIDTGHKSVDNRRKQWKVNHVSAEWFLFKDIDYMGRFHICCTLIRIEPNMARKLLLECKHDLAGIVEKLKNNAHDVLTSTDK